MGFEFDGININEVLAQTRLCDDEESVFEHDDLTRRLKKTLYYNPQKRPDLDTLSFSVTKSAVSSFRNAAPMPFGKLGHRYASRVARDACISPCALLLGLIYIERLKHKNPTYLESVSSSDLFLISMMVASKYLYDEGSKDEVFNDEWAVSGDVEVEKVNKLEKEFLSAIDWHLYVNPQQFSLMLNIAETDIAFSNGKERGWLSYRDLLSLLECNTIYKHLTRTAVMLSKATCMCMVLYSGLVCLAALTSSALISVSQTPGFERMNNGLHSQDRHHTQVLSEHNATTDSPHLDDEADGAFPGFSSNVFSLRQVSRKRISINRGEKRVFRDHARILTAQSLTQNEATKAVDNTGITAPKPDTAPVLHNHYTAITLVDNQQQRNPFCGMMKAMLLMAHVPTFFTNEDNQKNSCDTCRNRQAVLSKYQGVCKRFSTHKKNRNCSIYADCEMDLQTSTHIHLFRPSINRKRASGTLNPSVPPLSSSVENETNFARIPIIVY